MDHADGPTMLALSRQVLPDLGSRPADGVARGGYALRDTTGTPDAIVLATGSEVQLAVAAADALAARGIAVRVVSLPCWERFERQSPAYRQQVLPDQVRARVGVEAAVVQGWERWLGPWGEFVGMAGFGASAPGPRLLKEFGITTDAVVAAVERTLDRAVAAFEQGAL